MPHRQMGGLIQGKVLAGRVGPKGRRLMSWGFCQGVGEMMAHRTLMREEVKTGGGSFRESGGASGWPGTTWMGFRGMLGANGRLGGMLWGGGFGG